MKSIKENKERYAYIERYLISCETKQKRKHMLSNDVNIRCGN